MKHLRSKTKDRDEAKQLALKHLKHCYQRLPEALVERYPLIKREMGFGNDKACISFRVQFGRLFNRLRKTIDRIKMANKELQKKDLELKQQKKDYCRKQRDVVFDEDLPFDLDANRWIGSTAWRYADKRDNCHKEQVGRFQ